MAMPSFRTHEPYIFDIQICDQVGLDNRTQVHGGYHLTSRGPVDDTVLAKLPKVLQEDGAVVRSRHSSVI